MKKFFGVIACAAVVLASAMPAGATWTKHATFGTGGGASLTVSATSWQSSMRVTGLKPGKYDYVIGVWVAVNGNPGGGLERRICTFTSTSVHNTYACAAHGAKLAPNWGAPQQPNLFTGEIDRDLGYTAYPVAGDLKTFK